MYTVIFSIFCIFIFILLLIVLIVHILIIVKEREGFPVNRRSLDAWDLK